MRLTVFIPLILYTCYVSAQIPDHFERLECNGTIPSDFAKNFNQKYKEILNYTTIESRLKKNDSKDFAVQTSYFMDKFLQSGQVLFGDTLSQTCERIADHLLRNNTELRSQLRFYTYRSTIPNAFSSHEGIIFITEGLFARLKSEAELAFVLAHEIGHYYHKHSLEGFITDKAIQRGSGSHMPLGSNEKKLLSLRYSREAELVADQFGFDLFHKSGYHWKEIQSTFDLLSHGQLPIKEDSTILDLFETSTFHLNPSLFKSKIPEIKVQEKNDDTGLTHPNIFKRKGQIGKLRNALTQETLDNGKKYQIYTKRGFDNLIAVAQFDLLNLYVNDSKYHLILYTSKALQKDHGPHPFLIKMEAFSWYAIQNAFNNNSNTLRYLTSRSSVYGGGQQHRLYHFLRNVSNKQMNAIALRQIWMLSNQMVDSNYAQFIKKESLVQFRYALGKDSLYYNRKANVESSDTQRGKHLYDNQLPNALIDLFSVDGFSEEFTSVFQPTNKSSENVKKAALNQLIMTTPQFLRYDLRKREYESLLKSAQTENYLLNRIEDIAKRAGVGVQYINTKKDGHYDLPQINSYMLILDWIRHTNLDDERMTVTPNYWKIRQIIGEYGTPYLGLCRIVHVTQRKKLQLGVGGLMLLFGGWTLPLYLVWQFSPMHLTYYNLTILNLETNKIIQEKEVNIPSKYRKDLVASQLYHSFTNIANHYE